MLMKPFRFFSQKVLPIVYDDSLSYYEVLGKRTQKINEIIDRRIGRGQWTGRGRLQQIERAEANMEQIRQRIIALQGDEEVLRRVASDTDTHLKLENSEWVALVRTMAEGLSDKQRLVFTLCQLEGLSSDEAEAITGMDSRQVRNNLYLARQTIRQRLKKLGYE